MIMEKEVLIFKNVYLIYFQTYALGVRCKICTFRSMPIAHVMRIRMQVSKKIKLCLKLYVHRCEVMRNHNEPSGLPTSSIVTEECNFLRTYVLNREPKPCQIDSSQIYSI